MLRLAVVHHDRQVRDGVDAERVPVQRLSEHLGDGDLPGRAGCEGRADRLPEFPFPGRLDHAQQQVESPARAGRHEADERPGRKGLVRESGSRGQRGRQRRGDRGRQELAPAEAMRGIGFVHRISSCLVSRKALRSI